MFLITNAHFLFSFFPSLFLRFLGNQTGTERDLPIKVIPEEQGPAALGREQHLVLRAELQPLPLQVVAQKQLEVLQAVPPRPRSPLHIPAPRGPLRLGLLGEPVYELRRKRQPRRAIHEQPSHHQQQHRTILHVELEKQSLTFKMCSGASERARESERESSSSECETRGVC
jgi:hypothetical protein